jgi:hypothetical protein
VQHLAPGPHWTNSAEIDFSDPYRAGLSGSVEVEEVGGSPRTIHDALLPPLHGECNAKQTILTVEGVVWLYLEAACTGPKEWDWPLWT